MKSALNKNSATKTAKAFSLIEVSIVITILSIVLTALISLSGTKTINDKVKVGNDNIDSIYKALGRYVKTNKVLPCPASLKEIKSSSTTYGTAASVTNCVESGVYQSTINTTLVYGMVPTKTLGLSSDLAEDAYGNKIVYVTDYRLTTTSGDSFENNIGNSTLISVSGAAATTNAIFILMSRGANASGAFPVNGTTPIATSTDSNELLNDASSYIDNTPPTASTSNFTGGFVQSSSATTFDDVIFYKTQEQMFNDFKLWLLAPCLSATSTETLYSTSITWPKAYQGQVVAANTNCPVGWQGGVTYPSKKCGSKGNWGSVIKPCVVGP